MQLSELGIGFFLLSMSSEMSNGKYICEELRKKSY